MYSRRNIRKNITKNIVEVQEFLRSENILSSKGESIVAVNENIINIFTCTKNMQFLSLMNSIYVDATFNTYCKQLFCRLFTIHGFYKAGILVTGPSL